MAPAMCAVCKGSSQGRCSRCWAMCQSGVHFAPCLTTSIATATVFLVTILCWHGTKATAHLVPASFLLHAVPTHHSKNIEQGLSTRPNSPTEHHTPHTTPKQADNTAAAADPSISTADDGNPANPIQPPQRLQQVSHVVPNPLQPSDPAAAQCMPSTTCAVGRPQRKPAARHSPCTCIQLSLTPTRSLQLDCSAPTCGSSKEVLATHVATRALQA